MTRSEYIKSLVDQGLSREEIHAKLAEFDGAGKQQDPANVEPAAGSNNTGSSSDPGSSASQEELTPFTQKNKDYITQRNAFIDGTHKSVVNFPHMQKLTKKEREQMVDKFIKPPEISQFSQKIGLDQEGKTQYSQTEFFNEFENKINAVLDNKYEVTRDKEGNVQDVRDKNKEEEYDAALGEGMFGIKDMQKRKVAISNKEIGDAIFDVVEKEFIQKDPLIVRKQGEHAEKIRPQMEAFQEELLNKYQSSFTSDPKVNEQIYEKMNEEFMAKYNELNSTLYDDPQIQARFQEYNKVAEGYANKMDKKIGRFRDPSLKFYDKTGYLGDLLEGLDIGLTGMFQGFRGVNLNKQEKDVSYTQAKLLRLQEQLKKDPSKGDVEGEYITGTETIDVGTDDQYTKVKKKKGTLNSLIKETEAQLAEETAEYEKVLDTYMKQMDRQALFNQYSVTQGEVGLDDVLGTIGSVAPYMGVALIPYAGAPLVAASSYGNSRQDILANQMSEKLKKDVAELTVEDYITFAKNNEEDINEFFVASGAAAMAYLERIGATRVAKKFTKAVGLGQANKITYGSLLKGHYRKFAEGFGAQASNAGFSGLFEGGTEALQEVITGTSDYFADGSINDKSISHAFNDNKYLDGAELKEAAAAGALVGLLMPGLGGIAKQTTVELRTAARMYSAKFRPSNNPARAEAFFNTIKQELDRRLQSGDIDKAEYDAEVDYMQGLYAKSLKIKGNLNADTSMEIFDLMAERDLNKETLADPNTDESAHAGIKARIAELNAEIQNKQGVSFVESGIQQMKELGVTEDLDIVSDKSQQQLEQEFKNNKDAVRTSFGWYDPSTNKMYVNSELANTKGNVTTAQHEYLHPITKALIKSGKLKKETILDMVNKYDKSGYVQSRIDSNKETYTEEYLNKNLDEYIALFGEGVIDGQINIEENFSGVKNFFRNLLGKALPKTNIDFETAAGLKNFISEYSKSEREGKLTDKFLDSLGDTKIEAGEGGLAASAVESIVDESNGNVQIAVDRSLSRTKDGRMVDMDKVPLHESKFGDAIGGVVEQQTQKLFDKIPEDLTKVLGDTRQEARTRYKDALVGKAATIMQREWNPAKQKGQTMDSWLTQLIIQRSQSLASELGIEDTFKSDIGDAQNITQDDFGGRGTQQKDDELIIASDVIFNIESKSETYNKILNKVKDILKQKTYVKTRKVKGKTVKEEVTMDFNNPNLRKDLNQIFAKEIRKILVQEGLIPKNVDDYKAFLKRKKKAIFSKMSQDLINNRYSDLVTKVVDRMSRTESKTALNVKNLNAGNAQFVKNNIDSDAFVEYFTPRGRKESLGQVLAAELANDFTNMAMGDPEVLKERETLGLNKGKAQNETAQQAMARAVQRPTDLVFSKMAAEKSVGNEADVRDYNKIIKVFKSKDFIDDLGKYASDPSGGKNGNIPGIIRNHLIKAGLENTSRKEIGTIAQQMVPQILKTDIEANLDIENAGEVVAGYLLNKHMGSREVISVKAGVQDGFDKFDLDVVNNGRKGVKTVTEAIIDGEIYDEKGKPIKLKSKKENLKLINRSYVNPGGMAGFEAKTPGVTPSDIKVKSSEVKTKIRDGKKKSRTSLFLNESDINNNVNSVGNQNTLTSDLGKKDIYRNDNNADIDPENYKTVRDDGIKARKILKDYIDDMRLLVKHGYITHKQARIMIESQFQDTGGLGRQAAVLTYVPTKGMQQVLSLLGLEKDAFVFEHMIPANNIATLAFNYIVNGSKKSKSDFDKELDNYKSAIIPEILDKKLKAAGVQSIMGIKHKIGQDPLNTRYKNTFDFIEVHDLENGGTIGSNNFVFSKEYDRAKIMDKALEMARRKDAPQKGITVMDFDDTVAKTQSMIGVTMPDGKTSKINATQFAKTSDQLLEQGAKFDFSDFNKVKKGTKGPLFDKIKERVEQFGNKDVFILTARPQQAAPAIKKFLADNGVDIPIENITGLEDGSPQAKADFMIAKAAEGYNDFYFADDHIGNVKAVKEVLEVVDVKTRNELAGPNIVFSKDGAKSKRFNEILEETKGVKKEAVFSDAAGKARGAKKGRFNIFIPPSAEDLMGLMYQFMGKGKQGEAHKEFFQEVILRPLVRGIDSVNRAKQSLRNDYEAVKKEMKSTHKRLREDSGYNNFTNDVAVRVYLWTKNGFDMTKFGLSKTDIGRLTRLVEKDADLLAYATKISAITKLDKGYIDPTDDWLGSSIGLDIQSINQSIKRAEHLKEFNENIDEVFSPENKNKIRAIYGDNFVEALEDIIYRVKNGTNRNFGSNRLVNNFMNWINSATGTIMFLNSRSATLQTISFANFVNYSDNNILAAAKAFSNQSQFWQDFGTIFNSDFLKQRRGGMQQDVNWQEIADAVKGAKNPVRRAISLLLEKGFIMTQIADSFAIALGGSTFYRNRIGTYLKQGMSQADAEAQAFLDMQQTAEETQQSGRPDLISQQQASPLGRLILAFQNVTMQYNRKAKKEILDIINGRREPGVESYTKSTAIKLSRITYYVGMQNFVFNAMQQALFAMMFDDETEDEEQERYKGIANGMADSVLRGMGISGAIVATLKNMAMRFHKEANKPGGRADYAYVLIEGINVSPPVGSKARKIYSALQTYKFNRREIARKGFSLDNPAYEAIANVISAATNIPTDRLFYKIESIGQMLDAETQAWQRIALALGWRDWQLGITERGRRKVPGLNQSSGTLRQGNLRTGNLRLGKIRD